MKYFVAGTTNVVEQTQQEKKNSDFKQGNIKTIYKFLQIRNR